MSDNEMLAKGEERSEGTSEGDKKAGSLPGSPAPPSPLREHLFKIIATVVATLIIAFFQWQFNQLTESLVRAQCNFTEFTVEAGLDDIQVSLAAVTLNDLDHNSPLVRRLGGLVERARSAPKTCDPNLLTVVQAANLALRSYIDRRYDEVFKNLQALDPPKPHWQGLLYQLRGSAEFNLAVRAEEKDKAKLHEQAKKDLEEAEKVALSWGGAQGVRVALLASCRPFIGQVSREANLEAVKCLNRIKEHGVADHNTYCNLATKYARLEQDELALQNLQTCIDLGGGRKISRADVLLGGAFDNILKGPYKGRLEKILEQFKL